MLHFFTVFHYHAIYWFLGPKINDNNRNRHNEHEVFLKIQSNIRNEKTTS